MTENHILLCWSWCPQLSHTVSWHITGPSINIYQKVREWILFQPPLGDRKVCCVPCWGLRCQSLNFILWELHLMEWVGRADPSWCWLNAVWRQQHWNSFQSESAGPDSVYLACFSPTVSQKSVTSRGLGIWSVYSSGFLCWLSLSSHPGKMLRRKGRQVSWCLGGFLPPPLSTKYSRGYDTDFYLFFWT